jgi:hypothetical protein
MKPAAAFIGLLAVLTAHAQETVRHDDSASMAATDPASPGLFGPYPFSRDRSGTSWQPDSTPPGFADGVDLRRSETGGLRLRDDMMVTTRFRGADAFGLRASVASEGSAGISSYSVMRAGDIGNPELRNSAGDAAVDLAASYSMPLNRDSAVFGYVGLPGEPALGPPPSYAKKYADLDMSQLSAAGNWLDAPDRISQVFTLGYVWRKFKLEGSAFAGPEPDTKRPAGDSMKLDSRSGRLSFNPGANWALQLSRGNLSGLDQFDPAGEVRRTTISATYHRALRGANWQTTLAWGRNSKKYRESTVGYLVDSTLKVARAHAFFGRMEQVGSDDLMRENEGINRQFAKVNKLTVGYVYDIRSGGPVKFDVGGLVSRYYLPAAMNASYGTDPTSYMMFVRLKLK